MLLYLSQHRGNPHSIYLCQFFLPHMLSFHLHLLSLFIKASVFSLHICSPPFCCIFLLSFHWLVFLILSSSPSHQLASSSSSSILIFLCHFTASLMLIYYTHIHLLHVYTSEFASFHSFLFLSFFMLLSFS